MQCKRKHTLFTCSLRSSPMCQTVEDDFTTLHSRGAWNASHLLNYSRSRQSPSRRECLLHTFRPTRFPNDSARYLISIYFFFPHCDELRFSSAGPRKSENTLSFFNTLSTCWCSQRAEWKNKLNKINSIIWNTQEKIKIKISNRNQRNFDGIPNRSLRVL